MSQLIQPTYGANLQRFVNQSGLILFVGLALFLHADIGYAKGRGEKSTSTASAGSADGPTDADQKPTPDSDEPSLDGDSQSDAPDSPTGEKTARKDAGAKEGRSTSHGIPQVAFINAQIRQGWQANGLTPSKPCSDAEWCRRLFLDLLGRIPTVEELDLFMRDPASERRKKLVERLLGDDYIEAYARNWTALWTNILVGRTGGTEPRNMRVIDRAALQQALRRAFQKNMPYDRFVYELVSARGVNCAEGAKPDDKVNGFVNFLTGKMAENGVQATAKTSQVFLGMQVQCTQCHNHPFNEWKQNQFWELNAFFRQTKVFRRFGNGRDIIAVELDNQDFAGEDNNAAEATLFYEQRNGLTKAALPVFVDGAKLENPSGWVQDVDRRTELARMIVNSEYMPKAMINRMWAHFLGYGFNKPIDDMGPHNPPSHPELLDGLAEQFKKNSYDVKELIRWVVLSEPYSLSSRFGYTPPPSNDKAGKSRAVARAGSRKKIDDPSLGERPMFSHFYLRQMRAEELFDSLLTATEATQAQGNYEAQEKAKREWLSQFFVAFGDDENDETTTFNGSIPQSLMMWNGELIKQATSADKGGYLQRIASDDSLSNSAKINRLYAAALARQPSRAEISIANDLMALHKGNAVAALQDIWWAVLNSNEFILNH